MDKQWEGEQNMRISSSLVSNTSIVYDVFGDKVLSVNNDNSFFIDDYFSQDLIDELEIKLNKANRCSNGFEILLDDTSYSDKVELMIRVNDGLQQLDKAEDYFKSVLDQIAKKKQNGNYDNSFELQQIARDAYQKSIESINSSRRVIKSGKESKFSLFDINQHDPFVKDWLKKLQKDFSEISVESIGDDEIVFRVFFEKDFYDLNIFDEIATSCMPSTLIEYMDEYNMDFGYQFVYEDDRFVEDDIVFIRFIVW